VAFYGVRSSKRMGVLGAYPTEQMLTKLDDAVRDGNMIRRLRSCRRCN
jgi:hypothetical protein